MRLFLFYLLCILSISAYSINVDSTIAIIDLMPDDTNKIIELNDFAFEISRENPMLSIEYAKRAEVLAKSFAFVKGQIKANNILGISQIYLSDNIKSEVYFLKALTLADSIGDKKNAAKALLNLGATAVRLGKYESAIKYNQRSLAIAEEQKDIQAIAKCFTNIGIIYENSGNNDLALDYLGKAITYANEINDLQLVGFCMGNIGSVYSKQDKPFDAIEYYKKSIDIKIQLNDIYGLSIDNGNLASMLLEVSQIDSAMFYIEKCLYYAQRVGNKHQIAHHYNVVARILIKKNNYAQALENATKAFDIYTEIKSLEHLMFTSNLLANIYHKMGMFKKAFKYKSLNKNYGDSLLNKENLSKIYELETKYQTHKKEKEIELLNKDKLLKQEQYERQQQQLEFQTLQKYVVLLLFLLLSVVAFFIYRNYLNKARANILLTEQKDTIEVQNRKITASITYAQTIQEAIMPSNQKIEAILKNSFLLFLPLDIVSGDFFWIKDFDDKILVAVVDCTGHGVPGAFMSILGTRLLDEIDKKDKNPADILNELRKRLKKALNQSEFSDPHRDGLDIGLCSIDKRKNVIDFAGANIDLLQIKGESIFEINGDKQPVAVYLNEKDFNNHSIEYSKTDSFYLYSDGFVDQFGGANAKRYQKKRLKNFLIENSSLEMTEQRQMLIDEFNRWKGKNDQIDDVTVFGFKAPKNIKEKG